ncbi:bifunctional Golgi to ER traffic protein 4/Tetratricopeptide-like helical domain superfamily [Babesia duncani]|uniref:Bifunctional Golgi to ER traffic protein 4/Tetratricopeptide-like helical domain superfamily n=1 Tax=Babesia duncani TaxID=323732 RepID=A0AAD9UNP5_9APIC|nr:bifunctional Golgi to ER traffic protein 4/Tetratricopeptide-like helical domain superfamily [Babesia duncani]
MDFANSTKYSRINSLISQNRYYDALQHILSVFTRTIVSNEYDEGFDSLYHYSKVLIDVGEYTLVPDLMGQYVKTAQTAKIACNPMHLTRLTTLFDAAMSNYISENKDSNAANSDNNATMAHFMRILNMALNWSKSLEAPHGDCTLHKRLGDFYWHIKQFAKAHAHLIHSNDIESLFHLVTEWKGTGYADEADFFYLRSVLTLLSIGDCLGARCFLLLTDLDFSDPDVRFFFIIQCRLQFLFKSLI